MNKLEIIALSTNIYWAITLLLIIRSVRLSHRQNNEFVKSAIDGNVWLGTGDISISWFVKLYKKYIEIKGLNFLVLTSLLSFAICLLMACFMLVKAFIW